MAAQSNKVVITCAITGSIHTPTMSEALPITPDQIARQAIDAAEAGAAVLHLHARNPADGRPTGDPAVFRQFLPRIKQATDAVINITTGGSVIMTVEERLAAASELSPEMCSLNMGSMNFALYPMAARYKKWKYDWEEQYLLSSDANIFRNTFRDIEKISKLMGEGHGTKFEHECYDTGHLYNLAHCVDRGMFKPPIFLQLIFGILGGIGAEFDNDALGSVRHRPVEPVAAARGGIAGHSGISDGRRDALRLERGGEPCRKGGVGWKPKARGQRITQRHDLDRLVGQCRHQPTDRDQRNRRKALDPDRPSPI